MGANLARWEAVKRRVADLGRAHVRAGVVGPPATSTHGGTNLTNGEVAILHELGNPSTGLPARSFVGETMRDPTVQSQLAALQAKLTAAVVAGRIGRDQALGLIGAFMAAAIQRTITSGHVAPPLKPATVEAKWSSRVLVDSGQLVAAIGFEVVK